MKPAISLDPLDFSSRLEELKGLRDGWLDGKGVAPSPSSLDWLSRTSDERYADDLPLPYVYPVAEGGVRLEWALGVREVSVAIDLRRHEASWHSLDLETDQEEARPLNLDAEGDWAWMVGRLQAMAGSAR